jgi:hypothetical protein
MYRWCALLLLLASLPMWGQTGSGTTASTGPQSIGDAVKTEDKVNHSQPIYVIYVHGINQVGPGDSLLLRKGICKYLGECTVTPLGRVYADSGPFAIDHHPPKITYMEVPVWRTQQEWNASSPFIDRYKIVGHGHVPIIVDEYNWWPLVYPLKCKWLVPNDASLTGPTKNWIDVCSLPGGNRPDPDHPGRVVAYSWIESPEGVQLKHLHRQAALANRSLKNGLMDWGIGDAIMALGTMQEILTAGIRQLLRKTIEGAGADLQTMKPADAGPDFFVITHSLGSYLALAAIDSDWLGPQNPALVEFAMSREDKLTIDYFSAHATGFYFLANQLRLLELAGLSAPTQSSDDSPSATESTRTKSASITHWLDARQAFLQHHSSTVPTPQIIAWSDPNDLLSWDVPNIEGVDVVNIHVRNSGFKILPFLVLPNSAHANYAKNQKILSRIFKPNPKP